MSVVMVPTTLHLRRRGATVADMGRQRGCSLLHDDRIDARSLQREPFMALSAGFVVEHLPSAWQLTEIPDVEVARELYRQ